MQPMPLSGKGLQSKIFHYHRLLRLEGKTVETLAGMIPNLKAKDEINDFITEALASTTKDLTVDEMDDLVMKAGETAVNTMALLDQAHPTTYSDPEITEVLLSGFASGK
jgi:hydroxylamine reductase (hybrid-cluster protein)